MNQYLHLSSFDFSKKINDLAFKSNMLPMDVEKQYYFNLICELIKSCWQSINLSIDLQSQVNNHFVIDCYKQSARQNYWDCFYLCNFLANRFHKLNLSFNFNKAQSNNQMIFNNVLYYTSIFDNQVKNISFELLPTNDCKPEEVFDDSASGGVALEKIKLDENLLKEFVKDQKIVAKQKHFKPEAEKTTKVVMNNKKEFAFSNKKEVNKEVNKVTKIAKSVAKNLATPPEAKNFNHIKKTTNEIAGSQNKNLVNKTIEQPQVKKTILETKIPKVEIPKTEPANLNKTKIKARNINSGFGKFR